MYLKDFMLHGISQSHKKTLYESTYVRYLKEYNSQRCKLEW